MLLITLFSCIKKIFSFTKLIENINNHKSKENIKEDIEQEPMSASSTDSFEEMVKQIRSQSVSSDSSDISITSPLDSILIREMKKELRNGSNISIKSLSQEDYSETPDSKTPGFPKTPDISF